MIKKVKIPGPIWGSYFVKEPVAASATSAGSAKTSPSPTSSPSSPASHGSQVILLLHGYSESGEYFYNKVKDHLPQNALVIVPNAPFFIPVQTETGHRAGYSWYFYDPKTDEYIIDMKTSVNYISEILKAENVGSLTIIGYSQGGYLAPFVALALNAAQQRVQKVIGLSCQFLVDEFETIPSFQMTAIHGKNDEVVAFSGASQAVEKLQKQFVSASIIPAEGGHRLTPQFLESLKAAL